MTNTMIIFMKRCELMEKGIIQGTGRFVEVEINGEIKKFEEPEEIHTYQRWKELGYQVRKGEKSEIKFTIWKYSSKAKKSDDAEGKQEINGKMFMKLSAFFTLAQVDRIGDA